MKLGTAKSILDKYLPEIKDAPCSSDHHLNIKGGLLIHLHNVMEEANKLDPDNEALISLALIHDIGKARTYGFEGDKVVYAEPSVDHLIHTINMIGESGISLTPEELNVLQFHHGGWSPFKHGNLTELAVKLHYCDMMAMIKEDNNSHVE